MRGKCQLKLARCEANSRSSTSCSSKLTRRWSCGDSKDTCSPFGDSKLTTSTPLGDSMDTPVIGDSVGFSASALISPSSRSGLLVTSALPMRIYKYEQRDGPRLFSAPLRLGCGNSPTPVVYSPPPVPLATHM